jgi:hypothetical protein
VRGDRRGMAGMPRTRAILNLERIGRVGIIRATVGLAPIPPMTPRPPLAPRVCAGLCFCGSRSAVCWASSRIIMTIRDWHLAPSSLCAVYSGRNLQPMPVKLSCSQCGLGFSFSVRHEYATWAVTLGAHIEIANPA